MQTAYLYQVKVTIAQQWGFTEATYFVPAANLDDALVKVREHIQNIAGLSSYIVRSITLVDGEVVA